MNQEQTAFLSLSSLPAIADFRLGPLFVSPSRRLIEGPAGVRHLQPQVMLVFLCLAQQEGQVVTRRSLFDRCWGGAPVGDDSLNRTLSGIRQMLEAVGAGGVSIETVPRTGYRLVGGGSDNEAAARKQAVQIAYDCWRTGTPKPDTAEIAALESVLALSGGQARDWGILALLLRKAAEYADAADCAGLVGRCEVAARRALSLDPLEPNARVALAGLTPLFGNWGAARTDLLATLESAPHHAPALHDLAIIEMATGRPSVAAPIIEQLLRWDGLAATFHYKRMYHLWTLGDLNGAERMAARALALWPRHAAIWSARFWSLLFSGRASQALRLALDEDFRPPIPAPALDFLQRTAEIAAARDSGTARPEQLSTHAARAVELALAGPAHAVAALLSLCAMDAIDEAFEVAYGYYLGLGSEVTPLRWNAGDPSITDQHRRVTQPLFIPSAKAMRRDPRFLILCEDIGLTAYWERFGIVPDFIPLAKSTS